MDAIRIIQLSDCHISAAADAVYRGINPRHELESLLPAVVDWQPDLLLITGDLAEDGSRDAYEYLHATVQTLGIPVYTLPGNHDDQENQAAAFTNTAIDVPLAAMAGNWKLLLMNSARPGLIAGKLDEAQLVALESALAGHQGPAMVFLHHQPVVVGSPWIDRYALEHPERLLGIIKKHANTKVVGWGHVHQEFETNLDGVRFLSAPSSAINALPGESKFAADGNGPACRWFVAHPDGGLESGILRAYSSGSKSHKMM